ncbi:MAG: hypothetical protein R3324_12405 [Halobacteriales archaeon]|nr:hypothetical protein [Halobacteriales archaeon]
MDPVWVIVVLGVLGVLSLEALGDELYEPLGRAILDRISAGRLPGDDPGRLARWGVALTGLGVLLAGGVLLMWLVTALTA